MTPQELAELRRLHEAGSPLPWKRRNPCEPECKSCKRNEYGYQHGAQDYIVAADGREVITCDSGVYGPTLEDAELITMARSALPKLLDHIAKLEADASKDADEIARLIGVITEMDEEAKRLKGERDYWLKQAERAGGDICVQSRMHTKAEIEIAELRAENEKLKESYVSVRSLKGTYQLRLSEAQAIYDRALETLSAIRRSSSLAAIHRAVDEHETECAALAARESKAVEKSECTGLTAQWCPVHGKCACDREDNIDSHKCPLHSDWSEHGESKAVEATSAVLTCVPVGLLPMAAEKPATGGSACTHFASTGTMPCGVCESKGGG
jgi:DNA repair exonuclease SbcCD ATPase subunit